LSFFCFLSCNLSSATSWCRFIGQSWVSSMHRPQWCGTLEASRKREGWWRRSSSYQLYAFFLWGHKGIMAVGILCATCWSWWLKKKVFVDQLFCFAAACALWIQIVIDLPSPLPWNDEHSILLPFPVIFLAARSGARLHLVYNDTMTQSMLL
jgi:hypothetical protein